MSDDPLSIFRKRPVVPRPVTPAPPAPSVVSSSEDGRDAYEAFDVKDRVEGIAIRRRKGAMSYAIMYNYIHSVVYDDDSWTCLFLTVSGLHIEIRGRNLRPLADAIRLRCCDFIQEFRADRFLLPEPVDQSAPFVESISI